MKTRIARSLFAAIGVVGMAGAPAAFGGELRRDYREAGRESVEIRVDQRRLREDREDGRYGQAARDRAEQNRDSRERGREWRDIREDRREIRGDDSRFGWR